MRAQCHHCTALSFAREHDVPGLRDLLNKYYVAPEGIPLRYGIAFEEALEQELLQNLPGLVSAPESRDQVSTLELMDQGVPVIYQGTLRGGSGSVVFSGRPDFLLRGDYQFQFGDNGLTAVQVTGDSNKYSAWDAKLSQSPKVDYQNQVALYADVLQSLGYLSESQHGLILGSRKIAEFGAEPLLAQMYPIRDSFIGELNFLVGNPPKTIEDLGVLVCDASSYCTICEYPALCDHSRREANHLQLVANITKSAIESLAQVGVTTIRSLAEFEGSTEKLSETQVASLSLQARLQQHTYDTGEPIFEVVNRETLELLPQPTQGDLFFDIEGFTFFPEPGGLEYLWGYSEASGDFHFDWADSRLAEELAFTNFMTSVLHNQKQYPGSKVYHYANYEQAAIKKLSKRFGVFEQEVEDLLSNDVFIDLYKVVKSALIISQESYSIKKLENYYTFDRTSSVKEAMGSMEYYDQYLNALKDDPDQAEMLKRQVIAYNQDDCASTLALYKWLLSL